MKSTFYGSGINFTVLIKNTSKLTLWYRKHVSACCHFNAGTEPNYQQVGFSRFPISCTMRPMVGFWPFLWTAYKLWHRVLIEHYNYSRPVLAWHAWGPKSSAEHSPCPIHTRVLLTFSCSSPLTKIPNLLLGTQSADRFWMQHRCRIPNWTSGCPRTVASKVRSRKLNCERENQIEPNWKAEFLRCMRKQFWYSVLTPCAPSFATPQIQIELHPPASPYSHSNGSTDA